MNARKGLQRSGYTGYIVRGDKGAYVIERGYSPRRFYVRKEDWPRLGFFATEFKRLCDARPFAEEKAGVDNYPDPAMPRFLRRWFPEARV